MQRLSSAAFSHPQGGMLIYDDPLTITRRGVEIKIRMDTRKKVLVIDDDVDFGLALTYFFDDKPYRLFLAHTLSAGMFILENERPEFVFLDNGLPDGFGWEKAEYIMMKYPKVQLNLISALQAPVPLVKVNRVFQKPVSLEDMFSCLV